MEGLSLLIFMFKLNFFRGLLIKKIAGKTAPVAAL